VLAVDAEDFAPTEAGYDLPSDRERRKALIIKLRRAGKG
jgi:hypothetical protein